MRNLLQNIRGFLSSYVMNVFGLSFTFAAVIIISSLLYYELTYNRSFHEYNRIYTGARANGNSDAFSRPRANVILDQIPEIEYGSIVSNREGIFSIKGSNGEIESVNLSLSVVYKDFIPLFGMELVEGDAAALHTWGDLLIPLSMAQRYFPGESAVGKVFVDDKNRELPVVGVYRDFARNTSLANGIYTLISDSENINSPGNQIYTLYVKLSEGASLEAVNRNIDRIMTEYRKEEIPAERKNVLVNVSDAYFTLYGGSKTLVYSLLSIVLVLLLIAGINFVNISIALVPRKVRPINILKIFGASSSRLRCEQIAEAVSVSLFSFCVAVLLIEIYKMLVPQMAAYITLDPLLIYGSAAVVSLLMGIVVSLYPSWYLTSFPPMIILSGNFALSPKGRRLRMGLISFQYIASFVLILVATMINVQYRYMLDKDLGYNTDGVVVFRVSKDMAAQREVIEQKLKANPDITDVTQSDMLFGAISNSGSWGRKYSKGFFSVNIFPVSYNFLDFMEIKVDSGRTFIPSDEFSENGYFIMNRNAMDKFQFEPGEWIKGHRDSTQIVGIIPNINYTSLKKPIEEMAFFVWGKEPWSQPRYYYAKIGNNLPGSIQHIRNVIAELDPTYQLDIELFDKKFEACYQKERQIQGYMTQFCLLSILVSLVGVFGLIRYDAQFKLREIGIRKVNGATVGAILFSFCKTYLVITLISFIIAAPIGWYIIQQWLAGFPYQSPVPVWIFLFSLLFMLVMTTVVVVIQSYRAATLNPANIVRKN